MPGHSHWITYALVLCMLFLVQEWALGLLHTKCTCGMIWLTNMGFKRVLDQVSGADGACSCPDWFLVFFFLFSWYSLLLPSSFLPYFLFLSCFISFFISPLSLSASPFLCLLALHCLLSFDFCFCHFFLLSLFSLLMSTFFSLTFL